MKLTDEQREELNELGNEALKILEEHTMQFLDVIEAYTVGSEDVDIKQIDDVYKQVKQAAKETRKISRKYLKHLESVEKAKANTTNDNGEFTA